MRNKWITALLAVICSVLLTGCKAQDPPPEEDTVSAAAVPAATVSEAAIDPQMDETDEEELKNIEEYRARFDAIEHVEEIESNGYRILEEQTFPVIMESFGPEECTFLAAMEKQYHRLAIFLTDSEGNILFKTNQLETNNRIPGQLEQPTRNVVAVKFSDLNRDGLTDIVLITGCVNATGEYAGKKYKVGDVLFQGEQTFYRDWRISDKINRFDMNKSVNSIIAFVRDGQSTEFLYTSRTLDELVKNGFHIIEEQHYTRRFEKLGRIQVVPGTYHMSEYDIFMIYLVNEQGDIIWCFQPMGSYDNLYSLKGVVGKDVDGDGMKDLIVLARYSYEGPGGELMVETACSIYYQRTGGFDIDTGFTESYQCTDEDTMEALVPKIRAYWGWQAEEEEASD